jgi:bacterioferritin-associated ferredoxin
MAVDRCICRNVRFADALEIARRERVATVAELQRHSSLGSGCGLCVPYMQLAIASGVSDLPVLDARRCEELRRASGVVAVEEGE